VIWRKEAYFQMRGMKWAEMPAAENSERMWAASKTERRDDGAFDDDAIGVRERKGKGNGRGGRRGLGLRVRNCVYGLCGLWSTATEPQEWGSGVGF
jgi:hypothetical protein